LLICHSFGLQALPRIPLAKLGTLERDTGQFEAKPIERPGRGEVRPDRNPLRLQPLSQLDHAGCIRQGCIDQPLKACLRWLLIGPNSLVNLRFPQRGTVPWNRAKRLGLGIGIDVLGAFCETQTMGALEILNMPG
jgi:hypothetical protein